MIFAFLCFHTFETNGDRLSIHGNIFRISIKLYSNEDNYILQLCRQWVGNIGKLINQYNRSSKPNFPSNALTNCMNCTETYSTACLRVCEGVDH